MFGKQRYLLPRMINGSKASRKSSATKLMALAVTTMKSSGQGFRFVIRFLPGFGHLEIYLPTHNNGSVAPNLYGFNIITRANYLYHSLARSAHPVSLFCNKLR